MASESFIWYTLLAPTAIAVGLKSGLLSSRTCLLSPLGKKPILLFNFFLIVTQHTIPAVQKSTKIHIGLNSGFYDKGEEGSAYSDLIFLTILFILLDIQNFLTWGRRRGFLDIFGFISPNMKTTFHCNLLHFISHTFWWNCFFIKIQRREIFRHNVDVQEPGLSSAVIVSSFLYSKENTLNYLERLKRMTGGGCECYSKYLEQN